MYRGFLRKMYIFGFDGYNYFEHLSRAIDPLNIAFGVWYTMYNFMSINIKGRNHPIAHNPGAFKVKYNINIFSTSEVLIINIKLCILKLKTRSLPWQNSCFLKLRMKINCMLFVVNQLLLSYLKGKIEIDQRINTRLANLGWLI